MGDLERGTLPGLELAAFDNVDLSYVVVLFRKALDVAFTLGLAWRRVSSRRARRPREIA